MEVPERSVHRWPIDGEGTYRRRQRAPWLLAATFGLTLALACGQVVGGGSGDGGLDDAGRGPSTGGRAQTGGEGGRASGGAPVGAGGEGRAGGTCGSVAFAAEPVVTSIVREVDREVTTHSRVDMHLVLDRSGSMATSSIPARWEAVRTAITAFVNAPVSTNLGVGLQYFPLVGNEDSCSVDDHGVPVVPIQLLPSVVPAIEGVLSSATPGGGTPTLPALEGAHRYAADWAVNHREHRTVVVLITDGEPGECSSTVENVSAVAAAGLAVDPIVPTFVIGVGPSLDSLQAIATAGGGEAIFIDDTLGDPTQQVVEAFHSILGRNTQLTTTIFTDTVIEIVAVPCQWRIPAPPQGTTFQNDNVNIAFRAGPGAERQSVGAVPSEADCASVEDGWYFDDPVSPTQVHVCPQTCTTILALADVRLDLMLGCQTQLAVPR